MKVFFCACVVLLFASGCIEDDVDCATLSATACKEAEQCRRVRAGSVADAQAGCLRSDVVVGCVEGSEDISYNCSAMNESFVVAGRLCVQFHGLCHNTAEAMEQYRVRFGAQASMERTMGGSCNQMEAFVEASQNICRD